ncbi:MAG: hypothetical protein ACUVXG_09750 [Anaerolineae bacterium]
MHPSHQNRRDIVHLEALVSALPAPSQERFRRIFHVATTVGRLVPPPEMVPWIERVFGSVDAVREQAIVKVTNLITLEGALFNGLRAHRPMEAKGSADVARTIEDAAGDPFCHPETGTPADSFGRVRGKHAITASNVAKYDGFHGLVIFDEHNPLTFTREQVRDCLDLALAWAQKAREEDAEAKYFFFMWNSLWKSGASIIHGHTQMTLGQGMHYARVEALRRAALLYRVGHGVNYFDDLYQVHRDLDLAFEAAGDVRVLAYLTPIKEKEVLLVARGLCDGLPEAIYRTLHTYVHRLGVQSFNLALYVRPFGLVEEDWSGFPVVVRIVDRGDPMNRTADMGAMELYASSVIASDPFRLAEALEQGFAAP